MQEVIKILENEHLSKYVFHLGRLRMDYCAHILDYQINDSIVIGSNSKMQRQLLLLVHIV
jgi:hypothetical protein